MNEQAIPDCGEYGHDKGVCGNAQCSRPPVRPVHEDDFELPAKTCDLGRPEGCESCQ